MWGVTIGQFLVLNRRLTRVVERGAKVHAVGSWLATSTPIFVVEAFYLLLTYADVIVLQQYRSPNEVAIYYAAVKTMALRRVHLLLGGADNRAQVRAISRYR